jgi:hypothetical protein
MEIDQFPPIPTDLTGRAITTREDVNARLAERQLLLIVAGDNLDPRAEKLGRNLLSSHLTGAWHLAFVDLSLYEAVNGNSRSQYVLVPNLRGTVCAEVRQVVQIKVDAASSSATIQVRNAPSQSREAEPPVWTEERFLNSLRGSALTTEFRDFVEALARVPERHEHVDLHWGRGYTGTMTLKRNGSNLIECYLDGRIRFRPPYFDAALGKEVGPSYFTALQTLFPKQMQMSYPSVREPEVILHCTELLEVIEHHLNRAVQSS